MRYYKEKTIKTDAEIKKEQAEKEGATSENGAAAASTDTKASEAKSEEPQLVWVRKFKGSIFVVFKTVELAKKVLDEPSIEFKGVTIVRKQYKR